MQGQKKEQKKVLVLNAANIQSESFSTELYSL